MIEIDVRGMPELQAALRNLAEEQMPFALATAINTTAFKVKTALQVEMRAVIDRPTPWLIRQVAVSKATKQNLTAIVGTPEGIKDQYGKNAGFSRTGSSGVYERIIAPHVSGGSRRLRSSEHRLRTAGILPQGWYAVAAPDAPLDSYGNLPGSWWVMILSWLNALGDTSQGSIQNRIDKTSKRKNRLETLGLQVFAAIPGRTRTRHLHPGIYVRQYKDGFKAIQAAVLFVNRLAYRTRFDWNGIAEQTTRDELPAAMAAAVQRAIDTAR